jgi:antitoxin (DNA-binding transcriptional repressor) of toxin-antitoxin stability system
MSLRHPQTLRLTLAFNELAGEQVEAQPELEEQLVLPLLHQATWRDEQALPDVVAAARAAMRQGYHKIAATIARAPVGQGDGPAGQLDLIIRYHWRMRTITATEASRNFSDLLDAIERGETVTITRGHNVVAEMRPARRRTGADLRTALDDIPPPGERFAADIAGAVALLTSEGTDPWAGA